MSKSTRRFILCSVLMTSFFATQAFAGTSPTAAISAMRKALDPIMAKQGKELTGLTPDQRSCKVDLALIDNIDPADANDPVMSNVVVVDLNVATSGDDAPIAGMFDLDSHDEVKSLQSNESLFSIAARSEHTDIVPGGLLGMQEVQKTDKESMSVEINDGRIVSITIVNDKDQVRCNISAS
jgi:hypothetical protein